MPEKEEGKPEEGAPEEAKGDRKVAKAKYEKLLEEKEKAEADANYWKNEYYRVHADTQNLRKSLDEERRQALKYRAEGFLDNLLPALDGFHMALMNEPPSQETKNYLIGFTYIYNQIVSALESEGVSEIIPQVGDRYDATCMHAVEAVDDDGEEGRVLKVLAKGYRLHDRLIRPVMVSVSKKKGTDNKENDPGTQEFPEKAHKA